MKTNIILVCIILAFSSCQNNSRENAASVAVIPEVTQSELADSVEQAAKMTVTTFKKSASTHTPSVSSAANGTSTLPERKIIRTATVKSEVQNTEQATYKIEQISKKYAGFITTNNLVNQISSNVNTPVSSDSVMNTRAYQVTNNLVVRVPNQYLDTFLYEISALYTRLDHRNIISEDLTAAFLSNTLKAEVRQGASKQLSTDSNGRKGDLSDVAEIQNAIITMKDEAIEKQIENLETNYRIQYSQVNLEIYQADVISRTMQLNPSVLNPTPSFGYRFVEALKNGGSLLVDAFILVVNAWALVLMAVGIWILYRRYAPQIQARFSKTTSRHI